MTLFSKEIWTERVDDADLVLPPHLDLCQPLGPKAMTLVHSALAGGDSIDNADVVRSGDTGAVLGHGLLAPSTLGTFLRSFGWGHARQLDKVAGQLLGRAWAAGTGPGDTPATVDVDSTICETYRLAKEVGVFGHTKVRGYHPLVTRWWPRWPRWLVPARWCTRASAAAPPTHSGRGAASFLTENNHKVVEACRAADVRYSITAKLYPGLKQVIEAIDLRRCHSRRSTTLGSQLLIGTEISWGRWRLLRELISATMKKGPTNPRNATVIWNYDETSAKVAKGDSKPSLSPAMTSTVTGTTRSVNCSSHSAVSRTSKAKASRPSSTQPRSFRPAMGNVVGPRCLGQLIR
jgi:hypothetical protein